MEFDNILQILYLMHNTNILHLATWSRTEAMCAPILVATMFQNEAEHSCSYNSGSLMKITALLYQSQGTAVRQERARVLIGNLHILPR
jgi:hypothetical protein